MFYRVGELVFTRNKLISLFTTSREPSHYVVFSRFGRKESRRGSQVDCFLFFMRRAYIPLFLRITYLHILCLKNETNTTFKLVKTLTFICAVCKTLHVAALSFVTA